MTDAVSIEPDTTIFFSTRTRSGRISIQNNTIEGKYYRLRVNRPGDYTTNTKEGVISPLGSAVLTIHIRPNVTIDEKRDKILLEVFNHNSWFDGTIHDLKERLQGSDISPILRKVYSISSDLDSGGTDSAIDRFDLVGTWVLYGFLFSILAFLAYDMFFE